MKILVVICTFNRAAMLTEALESLCRLKHPDTAHWSVLVVNNRCTDHTDRVIAAFEGRLPLSRAYQPLQGLSNARNAAIDSPEAAAADYIVWTDDDVRVEPQWLQAYEAAFVRFADACVFGGNVIPWFEAPPPAWLRNSWHTFKDAFSAREFNEDFPLAAHGSELPYGANFAIRAREQRAVRYDPNLGVRGRKWLGGEETAVMRQVLELGHGGWWVSGASVRHYIPTERMSMAFVGEYFRGQGRTNSLRSGEGDLPCYHRPRWLWRRVVQESGAYVYRRLRRDVSRWPVHYRAANFYAGKLFG